MTKFHATLSVMFLAFALGAWAQGTEDGPQSGSALPAAAIGGDVSPSQVSPTPPLAAVDRPALEIPFSGRSYMQPSLQVSESANSNANGTSTTQDWAGITYAVGTLALKKVWGRSDTGLSYLGGGSFSSNQAVDTQQFHDLDFSQHYRWRTGQLGIRDEFSFLPEASFGGGFYGGIGSVPGTGSNGTLSNSFGGGQLGSLGQSPRITNTGILEVTQYLSPRSSVTLTGSYGITHFTDKTSSLLNSNQTMGQVSYDYQLSRRDQIAVMYGYQTFGFSKIVGVNFNDHVVDFMYGHQISNRMSLEIGGGPQYTQISDLGLKATQISGNGRASLSYRFPKTIFNVSFDHYQNSGSGLLVGSTSDVVTLNATRPISRKWSATYNGGYGHSKQVATSTFAIPANAFDNLFAGASLTRQLGPNFSLVFNYQFNTEWFGCGQRTVCMSSMKQHIAVIGLNWHPRPIRID